MWTRRNLLGVTAASLATGALALVAKPACAEPPPPADEGDPAERAGGSVPITVPSGHKAPFRSVDGVKVFHLHAKEIEHAFAPNLVARCWGYNGTVNGPLLEAVQGDRVRIYVTNGLPAPTTTHWHGLILPNGMDGVSGLTQAPIPPGETWRYEFDLVQHGTFMFHSHHDTMTQEGLGLTGMLVIHPQVPYAPRVDRDFALLLHEWRIDTGASRPNPNEMTDFNVLTINGKPFPWFAPLIVRTGQRVRMRIGNLSAMDHHPIHLHGYEFEVTAMDGQRIAPEQRRKRVTTLVAVGETRDIEFVADAPGDWAFHCHMTHHIMNQMGHDFPNMIGVDPKAFGPAVRSMLPGYMVMGQSGMKDMTRTGMPLPENSIPMAKGMGGHGAPISLGGMAGVLKVRDEIDDDVLARNEDPGWYHGPADEQVRKATPSELARDGIPPEA